MGKREKDTYKIKDLIPNMLHENKLKKGMDQFVVKEVWEKVMGKGVMSYTESISYRNNTLFVKLSSSALREELNYGKEKIVKMLNSSLKNIVIKSIKLI
jgi:Dna[CI] antecedent DciA-like protein